METLANIVQHGKSRSVLKCLDDTLDNLKSVYSGLKENCPITGKGNANRCRRKCSVFLLKRTLMSSALFNCTKYVSVGEF